MAKIDDLTALIQPVVESLEFDFWGIEYIQSKETTVRVYIDHENGINVDDCAQVSRQISAMMDVEDPISNIYSLEVSSPGVDRLLFTLAHFEKYRGFKLDLRLKVPFDGRRNFKGLLNGIDGDEVLLVIDNEEFVLPWELIDRAQVVPVFEN
jgi:ribosome maturation factor RimP